MLFNIKGHQYYNNPDLDIHIFISDLLNKAGLL